jgi:hypothetical protein
LTDGAGQPERIVRRDRPESVNDLLWSRLSAWRGRILVWMALMMALWVVRLLIGPTWLSADLWPLLWVLLLWWPVSNILMRLVHRLADWGKRLAGRAARRPPNGTGGEA